MTTSRTGAPFSAPRATVAGEELMLLDAMTAEPVVLAQEFRDRNMT